MDSLADKNELYGNRPAHVSIVLRTFRDITRWLVGFFTLTEEDRFKAGIYTGGEGSNG